jgi:Pectate lyase superfamily protein
MAMPARDMKPRGRGRVLASSLLAGLVLLTLCALPAAAYGTDATSNTPAVFRVTPSGGDDTQALQAALDAASAAGPGAVIQLTRGVFRVGRPLVGLNLDVTIRGAGMGRTQILAAPASIPTGCSNSFPPTRRQHCARSPRPTCSCLSSPTSTDSVSRSAPAAPSRSPWRT